jgi:CDP-diacylglycerol--glycerol-3-phosphate 3-phosphatidyltransferase
MATTTPGSRRQVLTVPNQLTLGRFGLALVLFWLIAADQWLWCNIVFAAAAFTDWLDGYLARKQNLSSTLGRIMDPLVDKVLMCGTYICLLPISFLTGVWLQPWMVIIVVARELVITGLRSFMESHGARFGADWLGKFKMGLQCAAVFGIFVALMVPPDSGWATAFFNFARDVLIWAAVAVTLLSGLQYLWKAATLLNVEA